MHPSHAYVHGMQTGDAFAKHGTAADAPDISTRITITLFQLAPLCLLRAYVLHAPRGDERKVYVYAGPTARLVHMHVPIASCRPRHPHSPLSLSTQHSVYAWHLSAPAPAAPPPLSDVRGRSAPDRTAPSCHSGPRLHSGFCVRACMHAVSPGRAWGPVCDAFGLVRRRGRGRGRGASGSVYMSERALGLKRARAVNREPRTTFYGARSSVPVVSVL
ncbi:hypothetical protein DENSPDRAFT_561152 [Dentipellis sp. KUC8613]|nr:hypothetical protein DENSPDRAFT_561152 [Dentipellis sp. KUC8613]